MIHRTKVDFVALSTTEGYGFICRFELAPNGTLAFSTANTSTKFTMDVTKLLSGFASEVLKAIIKHEDLSVWTDNAKKGDLVSALESYSNHIGFVIFTESLTRDELFDACTHLKIDLSSAGSRPNKAVLKKRLQEKLEELGPQKFCDKVYFISYFMNGSTFNLEFSLGIIVRLFRLLLKHWTWTIPKIAKKHRRRLERD